MKLKLILSLLMGAACFALALKGVKWPEVFASVHGLKKLPLLAIFVLMGITHYFRARRWGVLLRPFQHTSMKELFGINAVGFLAINLFPFRLGEFTRPLLLKRRHKISMSSGLAMVVIERVFDGLVAIFALLIGMMTIPSGADMMPSLAIGMHALALIALAIFVPSLGFLVMAVLERERALLLIQFILRLLPERFRARPSQIAENFIDGLRSLPNMKSFLRIFIESVGVWGVVVVAYWFGFEAFGLDLPWGAAFSIVGIASIGVMIPGPPGSIGTYHLFVQAALVLYGVSKSTGFAYSMVLYALNLLYVVLSGVIFLPSMAMPVRALYDEAQKVSGSTAS